MSLMGWCSSPLSYSASTTIWWVVWKRSLERCGLKPRCLYAQRQLPVSRIGDVLPADLAAVAGHSTKMLLDTYAKPTGRLKMPSWQTA